MNPQSILEDEGLFAARDGFVAPLSKDELLFQSAGEGDVHVMTDQVLRALDLCRPFRTVAEHVKVIMAAIPALKDRRDAVAVVLKNLADRGLLVRAADHLRRLNEAGEVRPADDRPLAMVRGGPAHALATDAADVLTADPGDVDLEKKIIGIACEALPESTEVIHWLLSSPEAGQFAAGQQRNLALLLGAGRRMAILDRDLDLTVRRMGVSDAGLTLAAASRPKVDFQATYELAAESGQPLDTDLLEVLFEHCGRPVADLLAQPVAVGIGAQSLAGQDLATLGQFSGTSRVMAVSCGLYGVDRRARPMWPWLLGPGAREQFAGDEEDYLHNRDAGYVWRTLSDHRLGSLEDQSPWCVDGRYLLPPVPPTGRWEGGLFNALMRYLYPHDTCLELAVAIGHRGDGRPLMAADGAREAVPELARFFADFADSRDNESRARYPEERMDFLGARMLDLAAAEDATLRYKLREYVTWFRATLIRSLQSVMVGWQQAPASWVEDTRALIEANGRALARDQGAVLDCDPPVANEDQQVELLRTHLHRYGEALVIWPHLWNLAREEFGQWQAEAAS